MINAGLIGYPLKHSASADLFENIFRQENISGIHYNLFPLKKLSSLPELILNHPRLIGLNVTTPFKTEVVNYLDDLDQQARQTKAVNTIEVNRDQGEIYLKGHNTDIKGFERMMQLTGINFQPAIILGSGGAAKAVEYVLKKHDQPYIMVSRNRAKGDLTYHDIHQEHIRHFPLIIQCTPCGMYPETGKMPPFPVKYLSRKNRVIDLIYNPPETKFLQQARLQGAATINGWIMLKEQALASWQLWKKNL
ncbi:MAG: shikimate dehydrogenase [Bacteroidales bacterium]